MASTLFSNHTVQRHIVANILIRAPALLGVIDSASKVCSSCMFHNLKVAAKGLALQCFFIFKLNDIYD